MCDMYEIQTRDGNDRSMYTIHTYIYAFSDVWKTSIRPNIKIWPILVGLVALHSEYEYLSTSSSIEL
jgi:hypothetical protein